MGWASPSARAADVTPLNAAQADLDAVEAIVRAAGTSFYRGMRVLPPDRRHAMYAIYAFCRMVDDIADEPGEFSTKLPQLAAWRERVAGLYRGESDGPVTRVLVAAVRTFRAAADGLHRGHRRHADGLPRPSSSRPIWRRWTCIATASPPRWDGCRCARSAMRRRRPIAWRMRSGGRLQLTNILRDLQEDAERGRLYLPREWLDEAGVPHEPIAALRSPGLPRVCVRVAALAHEQFRAATKAMHECDAKAMKPARMMGATYAAILSRLERSGWSKPHERVSLPIWQKLWLALRYGLA